MSIMSRISQAKAKFRSVQRAVEGGAREQAITEAKELGITPEQIRERKLAEKKRYHEIYEKERMNAIEKSARERARQGSIGVRFAKGLQRTLKENKAQGKGLFGGKGIDFGGSNLDLGGSKPKEIVQKKRRITIEL